MLKLSQDESQSRVPQPYLPRFFTPREVCRLQGFPENFEMIPNLAGRYEIEIPCESSKTDSATHLRFQNVLGKRIKKKNIDEFEQRFYIQIGNAVVPPVVKAVMRKLLTFVGRVDETDSVLDA